MKFNNVIQFRGPGDNDSGYAVDIDCHGNAITIFSDSRKTVINSQKRYCEHRRDRGRRKGCNIGSISCAGCVEVFSGQFATDTSRETENSGNK